MDWRYKIAGFFLLIFLTSCSLVPSVPLVTESPKLPTEIPTTPGNPGPEVPIDGSATPTSEAPTSTSIPNETATPEVPALTPTKALEITPTVTLDLLDVQIGSPVGIPNFAHPELGCQWMGVAGQVFNVNGKPLKDLVIELGGSLSGNEISELTILGQAEIYGPGGFEFELADSPIASDGTIWLRVYDFDGVPLSEESFFNTTDSCDQNLIIINFIKANGPATDWVYLPLTIR